MQENIDALKNQRTELLLQRAQAKDITEQCDRRLETLAAVLGVMEKLQADAAKAVSGQAELSEMEQRADAEAENSRPPLD